MSTSSRLPSERQMADAMYEQMDPTRLLEVEFVENGEGRSTGLDCQTYIKEEVDDLSDVSLDEANPDGEDFQVRLYFCETCPRAFLHEVFLQSHRRVAHGGRTPLRCTVCKQVVTTERGLLRHMQRHVTTPQLDCLRCGRQFHVKARLRQHLKACLQARAELCTYCGQRFNYTSTLRRHVRTVHCQERNHVCRECGKAFKLSRYLKRHQIIHTDAKPFKCVYCDRCFNRSGNLDVHERLHTGVKPYRCDVCGLAFRHNVSCKKHRLKHVPST